MIDQMMRIELKKMKKMKKMEKRSKEGKKEYEFWMENWEIYEVSQARENEEKRGESEGTAEEKRPMKTTNTEKKKSEK